MNYELHVEFTEPMLASSPSDPQTYTRFIESLRREENREQGKEVETLPVDEIEKAGVSVFHRDEQGLFLYDYKLRGFFKEAAAAVTGTSGLSAFKSKINKWLFVTPRQIHLHFDGAVVREPHGSEQRPIRAMTAQGPRVSLKSSEIVKPGTYFTAHLTVLPLGLKEITEGRLREWLDYGVFSGFGEWRTGSYGRFTYKLTKE